MVTMETMECQPGAAPLPRALLERLLAALAPHTGGQEPGAVRFRGGHSNDVTEVRFPDERTLVVKRGRYGWAAQRFRTAEAAARLLTSRQQLRAPRPLPLPPELSAEPLQAYWRIDLPTLEQLWPRLSPPQRTSALRSWGRLSRELHRVRAPGFAPLHAGTAADGTGGGRELEGWLRAELECRLLPSVQSDWPEGGELLQELIGQAPEAAQRAAGRAPVLVHNDLHAGNVLCRPEAANVRCVGLLDLEAAVGGLPEMDVASAMVLHGAYFRQPLPGGWLHEWQAGYGAALDGWLLRFFRAYHLANQGYYSALVGHDVHARSLAQALRRELRLLRARRAPRAAAAASRHVFRGALPERVSPPERNACTPKHPSSGQRPLLVLSPSGLSYVPASDGNTNRCRSRTLAKKLKIRAVTPEEERELRKLPASRTAPARLVERAKVLVTMLDEPETGAMEAGRRGGLSGQTRCAWVKRFYTGGLDVLEDEPRGGRPPTHPPEVRSTPVGLALQKPRSLGLPFGLWTLERLQREFKARDGVHLSDSTIWTWLRDEGLHWKRQQTWFHDAEKHDPEFVENRGPSSGRTRRHLTFVE